MFGRAMLDQWMLDPTITYLNHGTVGAPPRRVLAAQQALRDEIERQPSRFLLRELTASRVGRSDVPPRLRAAAGAVAEFLGARGDDLVFTENVTAACNAVLRSFELREGDEILLTDQVYGGVERAARFAARQAGATLRTVALPHPVRDPAEVVEAFAAAVGPRTRLAVVEHITAPGALVLPVAAIAARLHAAGVAVLVDAAHAPGAIAVDIASLGVDWYAANLHKWMWTPRSCGILWAAPERQAGLHAPVTSWGLDEGFVAEFDWSGTRDPSPMLAAPAAIACLRELGFERVCAWNHGLAWEAARFLAGRWDAAAGGAPAMPESMVGAMAAVALPAGAGATADDAERLRDALLYEDRIEVALNARAGRLWARLSAQVYNDMEDVRRFAAAVEARVPAAAAQ